MRAAASQSLSLNGTRMHPRATQKGLQSLMGKL